jgi:hypothetical protein
MTIIRRSDMVCFNNKNIPDNTPPDVAEGMRRNYLPSWFVNALPEYRKIIRVLGATGGIKMYDGHPETMYTIPLSPADRLYGNIANDTMLNGFVMCINNYMNTKEFDVTHSNLTELTWDIRGFDGESIIDPIHPEYIDLVVEVELLLTSEDYI